MPVKSKVFYAVLFLIFSISFLPAFAQNSTSSPYSRFAFGDLNAIIYARNLAMGGIEQGLNHSNFINPANPASYSSLTYTTYEGGLNFNQYELKTKSRTQHTNDGSFAYFDFAFPLKANKWSLGFGLKPFSKVGYSVVEHRINALNDEEIRRYTGSGGLNNFHLASGFKISKKFSIGADVQYLFGVINRDHIVEFTRTDYIYTRQQLSTSIGWFNFRGGIQFTDTLKISKSDSLLMYDRKIEMLNDSLRRMTRITADSISDTLSYPYEKRISELNELKQQRNDSLASHDKKINILRDELRNVRSNDSISDSLVDIQKQNLELQIEQAKLEKNNIEDNGLDKVYDREIKIHKKTLESLKDSIDRRINDENDSAIDESFFKSRKNIYTQIEITKRDREAVVERRAKRDWLITAGLSGNPSLSLHAKKSNLTESFRYINITGEPQVLVRDTIVNTDGEKGSVRLPMNIGAGFALKKGTQWIIGLDYNFYKWSDFTYFNSGDTLQDSWRVSLGAQLLPNERSVKSFFKHIQYRAGVHYEKTFLRINTKDITEMGISAGFAIPVKRSAAWLHFSAEGGQRGTTENLLIRERYVKFTFGFTVNDFWFFKPKID
jgi:hypothetical protein